MTKGYEVGMILENGLGQFSKVVSLRNGVYGLSGWTTRGNAEKADHATAHVNRFGMAAAVVRTYATGKAGQASRASSAPRVASPKAAAKKTAKKVAAKKAVAKAPAKKVATKKAAKRTA